MFHRSCSVLLLASTLPLVAACGGQCPSASTPSSGGGTAFASTVATASAPTLGPTDNPPSFTVKSSMFADGATMPMKSVFKGFGCTGENVSPDLTWSGEPAGTKSFAIVVHDPDAPTGVGFFHWVAFNIPASTHSLPAGFGASAPPAGQGMFGHTDFGANAYGGPCPPPGAPHRYRFDVYALDTDKLPADASSTGALVRFLALGHTLARGTLTGTYGR